jgi:ferredoxin-NADP reductase
MLNDYPSVSRTKMAAPVQQSTVIHIRDLTPSVRELTLATEQAIHFSPGQWVSLKLPVGERPPLVRAYSMAEPVSTSGKLVLVFDRVPNGLGSGYLFTLKPGQKIPVSGPYGRFVLPEPLTKDLLFIARFTGIVPIRCIMQDLRKRGPLPRTTLIYIAPCREELIYDGEFRQLAATESFRYHPLLEDDSNRQSEYDIVRAMIQNHRDVLPMVAGTKAFLRPLRARLSEMGFERREIKHESYD